MKKFLPLFAFTLLLVLTSCTSNLKDDISDLQSQLDEFKSLTLFPAIKVTNEYSYDANTPIKDVVTLYYSSKHYQYIEDNEDGTYEIYIYNFDNPAWYDEAELEFTYNSNTGEATLNNYYGDYINDYGDRVRFNDSYYNAVTDTQELVINSINLETGKISLVFTLTYSATSNSNVAIYGTAGTLKIEYDGTLPMRSAYPTN
ncbi:hypothetical protein ACFSKN_00930 [Mariniflexile gromovii]|uniref:Uncharacterized protein n=1 Tax=Mariniflexile gromovii TaxID=362523 RepID=A0ABS4BS91_9FLAO|nr:hypothetical protein [Mariniflexile gromovii]MBP0903441.1 hypothetical protein [Mariniflexile gromovii]